jgi:teichuronic acid biosynthesis glycosyltransferase TuaC
VKVLFVYSGNSAAGINRIVETQADSLSGKSVIIEKFPLIGKGFTGYLKNVRKLSRLLAGNKYDIIHAHYGLSGIIAFYAKRREKLLVSFMGDDLVGSNKRNGTVKLWSLLLARINSLFARYLYDFSIIKSEEMKYVLLKNTPHALIPNGVNMQLFVPASRAEARLVTGGESNKKIALFLSDPERAEKNYKLADEAVKLCECRVFLKTVTNCNQEELPSFYNAADLLLLTSFHEGSPNVVKEAMACGCPVVSTDVGDIRWLFGDTPGCFISTFDPQDVSEKIDRAIKFREENNFSGGRERIKELGLDSESVSVRITEIYKLLSGRSV